LRGRRDSRHVLPTSLLTTEVFTIPLADDRVLVYAPLRGAAFAASHALVDAMAALRDGDPLPDVDPTGSLVEFLRRLGVADGGADAPPPPVRSGPPSPTDITLFLTTACNLRCTYCYAEAGDTPIEHMSFEVAKRGIDFVLANAVDLHAPAIGVNYHGGGEPTVNWRVLTSSFD